MILVTGIILNQFDVSYKEKIHAHLGELINKHKQNIDAFLKEKQNDIRFLVSTSGFKNLQNESVLKEMLISLQKEYGFVFEDLGVVNGDGLQVAYAGPYMLEKANYSTANWYRKAIESQTPYFISDVFMGLRGHPHFIVSVRRNIEGKLWILRATINFLAFNSLVENLRIGKTGFAFILNKDGEFQTNPQYDFKQIQLLDVKSLFHGETKPENGIYILERKDGGTEYIFVGAYLKEGDWLLIYRQEAQDAFSDLHQAQLYAVAIFLVGGLGIIITSFILTGRMVDRIAQSDREKEMMNQQVIETGKLASIGQLAAGIAHEINNPVAIMVEEAGWMQDLLEEEDFRKSENFEEYERSLNQIQVQGKRCKDITHKLLSFARKTDSEIEYIQINELIEDIIGLSAQRAKFENVEILTHLNENIPQIHVSPTEIQQVLLNIFNNSLDAMENLKEKNGKIQIFTRKRSWQRCY